VYKFSKKSFTSNLQTPAGWLETSSIHMIHICWAQLYKI